MHVVYTFYDIHSYFHYQILHLDLDHSTSCIVEEGVANNPCFSHLVCTLPPSLALPKPFFILNYYSLFTKN